MIFCVTWTIQGCLTESGFSAPQSVDTYITGHDGVYRRDRSVSYLEQAGLVVAHTDVLALPLFSCPHNAQHQVFLTSSYTLAQACHGKIANVLKLTEKISIETNWMGRHRSLRRLQRFPSGLHGKQPSI